MGTQNSSKNVVLIDLPPEPKMRHKIRTVTESLHNSADRDVVMDFSSVGIVATPSISGLLGLRKLLADSGHSLILRNVASATRGIFTITGLDAIFDLVEDKLVDSAVLKS